jgi:hypothetical protein
MSAAPAAAASARGREAADPSIAVLVPLEDARGDVAKHLRTWTHGQTLDRDRFQVVIASDGGDEDGDRALEALLAAQDALVRVPGATLVDLWNAAAARAEAEWIVLTEAHCLGAPDCLAALARAVARDPTLDAASLDHGHQSENRGGVLGERWFRELGAAWDRADWRYLNFVGVAVRRSLFDAVGGLDAEVGLFSAPRLSARLHERGARVGHVADATVVHVHNESLRDHHELSADYARGECRFRAAHDPVYCERYFGYDGVWANRLGYRPEVARAIARDLLDALGRAAVRRRADVPFLARELVRRLPASTAGARPRAAAEALLFRADELAAQRLPLPAEARYARFLRAQDRVVRVTRLRWLRDHVPAPDPPTPGCGGWAVSELDDAALVGAHALERDGRRTFRWTEPVALLRLVPPPGDHELVLDTAGMRGAPLSYVTGAYAGGRRVSRNRLDGDETRLVVPLAGDVGWRSRAAGVTILSRPLDPRTLGAEDPRALGLPLFSVELRRRVS